VLRLLCIFLFVCTNWIVEAHLLDKSRFQPLVEPDASVEAPAEFVLFLSPAPAPGPAAALTGSRRRLQTTSCSGWAPSTNTNNCLPMARRLQEDGKV
jgi:hypothetical protein